jgi:hypothetical protein
MSVLSNRPRALLIVTVGQSNLDFAEELITPFRKNYPDTHIRITKAAKANKRSQICDALPEVHTEITVMLDDHVSWLSENLLPAILAPFEDEDVGLVGVNNTGRRFRTDFGIGAFWNLVGNLYLERHNWDSKATISVDGGLYVVAGRTYAVRTFVLKDPKFRYNFTNERFFFGLFGPLNADDDNFITRWALKCGWKVKYQECADSTVETTIGAYPKFISQCLRWARTTWRSNTAVLFTDRIVYSKHPWCVYAVYLASFFNFALFYDAALVHAFTKSTFNNSTSFGALLVWIVLTKLVKVWSYFARYPSDLVYVPAYLLFIYAHSIIKLWAGVTFYELSWGSRDLSLHGDHADEKADYARPELHSSNSHFSATNQSESVHFASETKKKMKVPTGKGYGDDMEMEATKGFVEDLEFSQETNGSVTPIAKRRQRWFSVMQSRVIAAGLEEATLQITSKVEKEVKMQGVIRSKTG